VRSRERNTTGNSDISYSLGTRVSAVVAGDWNGDCVDTLATFW
jgi:hypothetical protein